MCTRYKSFIDAINNNAQEIRNLTVDDIDAIYDDLDFVSSILNDSGLMKILKSEVNKIKNEVSNVSLKKIDDIISQINFSKLERKLIKRNWRGYGPDSELMEAKARELLKSVIEKFNKKRSKDDNNYLSTTGFSTQVFRDGLVRLTFNDGRGFRTSATIK